MISIILALIGYEIVYTCSWGMYKSRYDSIDIQSTRPIHKDMSVAPPWAEMIIRKVIK